MYENMFTEVAQIISIGGANILYIMYIHTVYIRHTVRLSTTATESNADRKQIPR